MKAKFFFIVEQKEGLRLTRGKEIKTMTQREDGYQNWWTRGRDVIRSVSVIWLVHVDGRRSESDTWVYDHMMVRLVGACWHVLFAWRLDTPSLPTLLYIFFCLFLKEMSLFFLSSSTPTLSVFFSFLLYGNLPEISPYEERFRKL